MKLKDGAYNADIFWPDELQALVNERLKNKMPVICTEHYRERAQQYKINVGVYKAAMFGKIVEAYVSGDKVVKIVTRLRNKYAKGKDCCFAISFVYDYEHENTIAIVKTCWQNNELDGHDTKTHESYVRGFLL